jgi:LysR family glycine cleavage system transcriptional activator
MAKRDLPPLNSLRAFEAAARLGSFAAAAQELGVTAGAISQQMRGLEARLGLALFERRPQSLLATRAARELLPVVSAALDDIEAALRRLRVGGKAGVPLRLASPAGFAAGWLLPRLQRFHRRAPGIALVLSATERLVMPGESDGVDAAIRFGRAGWDATLGCDFLFADRRIPVASPSYLQAMPMGAAAADPLFGHTLLEALPQRDDWADWLAWSGWPAAGARRLGFGDERLALEAALGGLGVALADRALVAEKLASGLLVAPFEPMEMLRGTAWFLVWRASDAALAAPLRQWLLDEIEPAA